MNIKVLIYRICRYLGGIDLKYLYVLMGLAILLSIISVEAGSFSPVMTESTYVDAAQANESFGGTNTLWVSSIDGKPINETYLSYAFNGPAITPDQIQSATLKIYADKVEKPGKVTAYFVDGPTFETATWSDKPEYDSNISAGLAIDKSGEYSVDVTPLIKMAAKTCLECGFSIALVADDSASIEFSKTASEKALLFYNTAD